MMFTPRSQIYLMIRDDIEYQKSLYSKTVSQNYQFWHNVTNIFHAEKLEYQ